MTKLLIARWSFSEEIKIQESIEEIDAKLESKVHTWKDSFLEFTKEDWKIIRISPSVILYFS